MSLRRSGFRKEKKPLTPLQAYKRSAPLALRERPEEEMDTRELAQRKIHPVRDRGYMTWLWQKPCAVDGLVDEQTGQVHVCWSPDDRRRGRAMLSDPAHTGKVGMGKKGDDSGCWPLCRHAHRLSESNMNDFDRRYKVDRFEIAAKYYAEYREEQERRK